MIKVMFVCLGNICRSPMAEFVFKDIIKKQGLENEFIIESSATSVWEIGNPVHQGTKNKLAQLGISVKGKTATQLTKADYNKYDYIIGMEQSNIRDILKIVGEDNNNKVYKLLDFVDGGDIADPWYTGDFDKTYDDIYIGLKGFLEKIKSKA